MSARWNPKSWVSLAPNGIGHTKPNHYGDMLRIALENRDQLGYAWRILRDGVCDGCALGTSGLHDHTIDGIHLCMTRLNLLRLNTMPALDESLLHDVERLRGMSSEELRKLGRIPFPMIRRPGEPGFTRISWDQALDYAAGHIRETTPERLAFYVTSRGLTNESYYAAGKVARFLGTNNVDNAARICHSPSTVALKATVGVGASTCSYSDWIGTDLLVFFGSDVANNQPVSTKYMYYAKRAGTKIVVVNPYREPGMERYWVPSVTESALFGTKFMDAFFQVHTGGDIAFINGVLKYMIEQRWVDEEFIDRHTSGFEALKAALADQTWDELERSSGIAKNEIVEFATMYRKAKSAVFVWSMGITQHLFGVDNVKAIVNLALARGMLGREKCGLMPIRGHSGVQGGAEVGCAPGNLPGGIAVDDPKKAEIESVWGFSIPERKGMVAGEMLAAAHRGELDILYSIGGNFVETMPDPGWVREALQRVRLRVHQDIVLNTSTLLDAGEAVLVLPATTRYEQPGGGTETNSERRIYFSPEIPGRRIPEARSEWEILTDLAARVRPGDAHQIRFASAQAIRDEIAKTVPDYNGIQHLRKKGDAVQWGGPLLCVGGVCPTPDGRGQFTPILPPERQIPDGHFILSTRRGKQFNSMVYGRRDPLTGASRDSVFMSAEDAARQGLSEGDRVVVKSPVGEMEGTVLISKIKPGNLQVYWPEGNVLIRKGAYEPQSGVPDYNAFVTVSRVLGHDERDLAAEDTVAAAAE